MADQFIVEGWHFEFEAPIGERILRHGFLGIEAGWSDATCPEGQNMWWDMDGRRWIAACDFPWGKNNPDRNFVSSSCAPCRSFSAFKRHLRKHGHGMTVGKVRLVSRYVGHDIFATRSGSAS